MNKAIGYSNTIPLIKEVNFPAGKIILYLMDGRIISLPIEKFPEIAKLTTAQRRRHKTLAGMGLMFDDCDTVFHVSDFIGKVPSVDASPQLKKPVRNYSTPSARQLAEPNAKYKKA